MLALAALLLAAQPDSPAADWWYVTAARESGPVDIFYSDRASRRRAGDRVQIDEARESDVVDRNGTTGARLRLEYDCRARTGQILVATFLTRDGAILRSEVGDGQMQPIPQGSTADTLLRFACDEGEGREAVGSQALREHALRLFPTLTK